MAAERRTVGSEPHRLRSVGDPTRVCVQPSPDHGRGRAAPACIVEEKWDRLDQEVIDNAIREWRKRLTACVAADRGHFEHSL